MYLRLMCTCADDVFLSVTISAWLAGIFYPCRLFQLAGPVPIAPLGDPTTQRWQRQAFFSVLGVVGRAV